MTLSLAVLWVSDLLRVSNGIGGSTGIDSEGLQVHKTKSRFPGEKEDPMPHLERREIPCHMFSEQPTGSMCCSHIASASCGGGERPFLSDDGGYSKQSVNFQESSYLGIPLNDAEEVRIPESQSVRGVPVISFTAAVSLENMTSEGQ